MIEDYCYYCDILLDEDSGWVEMNDGIHFMCGDCAEAHTMPGDNWW